MRKYILSALVLLSASLSYAQEIAEGDSPQTVVKSPKSGRKKANTSILMGQAYQKNLALIKEGFTTYPNGTYYIKDYLVKGQLNFICLTSAVAASSGYLNSGASQKNYFIQNGNNENSYREIFIVKKRGYKLELSKAILLEIMNGNSEVTEKIKTLTIVNPKTVKKLVKQYNNSPKSTL